MRLELSKPQSNKFYPFSAKLNDKYASNGATLTITFAPLRTSNRFRNILDSWIFPIDSHVKLLSAITYKKKVVQLPR